MGKKLLALLLAAILLLALAACGETKTPGTETPATAAADEGPVGGACSQHPPRSSLPRESRPGPRVPPHPREAGSWLGAVSSPA